MTLHWPESRSAALTPSMTGMRMSSSTTSGCSASACSIASRPVEASPTTSMSSAADGQQGAHALADDRVVVGDEDPDHSTASSSTHGSGARTSPAGRRTVIVVPAPRSPAIRTVAPIRSPRSAIPIRP